MIQNVSTQDKPKGFKEIQQVLDYRDLDYRDPRNTGIYKKFHSSITVIFLLIHPHNTEIFRMPL